MSIVQCPICGADASIIYRRSTYSDVVGCNNCLYAVDAQEDADANPEDYGLEKDGGIDNGC